MKQFLIILFAASVISADFTFISFADTRSYWNGGLRTGCSLAAAWNPVFAVTPGDMDPVEVNDTIILNRLGSNFPWFNAVGNHEGSEDRDSCAAMPKRAESLPGFGSFTYGPAICPLTTYSFVFTGPSGITIQVICLDGYTRTTYSTTAQHSTELHTWLEGILVSSTADYIIVFAHPAVFGKFRHGGEPWETSPMAEDFWNLLLAYKASCYFNGHSHYSSWLAIDDHPNWVTQDQYRTGTFDPDRGCIQMDVGALRSNDGNENQSNLVRIDVKADRFTYSIYKVDGTSLVLKDSFDQMKKRGPAKVITGITVSPPSASIEEMLTQQFSATALYDDATSGDISNFAAWNSTDNGVATVSATGMASGISTGQAGIVAAYSTFADTAELTVTATTATIDSLVIGSHPGILVKNGTLNLTATGYFSNQLFWEVTQDAIWSSSNTNLATVDKGVVTGKNVGDVVITAELDGKSDTAIIHVDTACLILTWKDMGYNHAGWATGPAELGYGDGDEATVISTGSGSGKNITAYFCRTFTVSNLSSISSLMLGINYDDGAVVYLNGSEVGRYNMPSGDIGFDTVANGNHEGGTFEQDDISGDLGQLVNGDNFLAVEVHQNYSGSSDLGFDLELKTNIDTPIQKGAVWSYYDLDEAPADFNSCLTTITGTTLLPDEAEDLFAVPNPFNPATRIYFRLSQHHLNAWQLKILDVQGKIIKVFGPKDYPTMSSKVFSITWHAGNRPSGIYIAELITGRKRVHKNLILLK